MLETIYLVVAVLAFFAQLRNGFFMALLDAVFWPIVIVGLTLFNIALGLYVALKR